ncbi:MAG TPA: YdcF family protein [Steroidobacteraceae bacterium]|nr:YdcF family protein [Steroidobacteraceae bacterium]
MLLFLDYTKTVLKGLLLPPSGLLLLTLIGALLLRRRPRLGGSLMALSLIALTALSLPVIADALTRSIQHYPAFDTALRTQAQAIVILGGGGERVMAPEYAGPAPGPYLLERLAYGAYVARRTGLPILVSGWHLEASAMRDSLRKNFALEPRWVDSHSYDTFDNAHNAASMLAAAGIQRIILVTSTQHMWRAAHEFSAAGVALTPAPVGVIPARRLSNVVGVIGYLPEPQALEQSRQVIYEVLGERVRELLVMTHLRRQQLVRSAPPPIDLRSTPAP